MWKQAITENLFKFGKLQVFEEAKSSTIIHCPFHQSEKAVILFKLLERLRGLLRTILNNDLNSAGKTGDWRIRRFTVPVLFLSHAVIPPDLIAICKKRLG